MPGLGVFGGSFNPVHWGHLHVALLAREASGLDAVLFVPAASPPHKPGRDLAPALHRLAMLRLALAGEPGAEISEIELEPGGPRYTADTLDRLAAARPGVELHFILGFDSLRDLPGWRDPEGILARHRVIAVDRPGIDRSALPPDLAARCRLVEGNPFAVSASGIRARAAAGRSIRHLVPPEVERYILAEGLYRRSRGAA